MKLIKFSYLLLSVFSINFSLAQDCDLPPTYDGNTGFNMSVFFTSTFLSSLNATDENAYLVALTSSGLVVGSTSVYGLSQTSIALWSDDSQTPEIDGALANEVISFQLVNGTDLYDVSLSGSIVYVVNDLILLINPAVTTIVECNEFVYGCTDATAFNYNSAANTDDNSCIEVIEGCTDATAFNYNSAANTDDNSCIEVIDGCTDTTAFNYNSAANTDDNSCIEVIEGCTDTTACNYNAAATNSDACVYATDLNDCATCSGEQDGTGTVVDNDTDSDGVCDDNQAVDCVLPLPFEGSTSSNMAVMLLEPVLNSLNITDEDAYLVALTESGLVIGSLLVYGVTATTIYLWADDSETLAIDGAIPGEMISFQLVNGTDLYDVFMPEPVQYDPLGLVFQLSSAVTSLVECTHLVYGCTDSLYVEYNSLANTNDQSCITPIVLGCTDTTACNYNAAATNSDACVYARDLNDCATCSGEQDGTGTVVDNDTDSDGVCDSDEILGCTDTTACNYNVAATDSDDDLCYTLTVVVDTSSLSSVLTAIVSPADSVDSFSWLFNGVEVGIESTYTALENGVYSVEVSNSTCDASASYEIQYISLHELNSLEVNLYPNPFKDIINIEFIKATSNIELRILNTLGEEVKYEKIVQNRDGSEIQIQVSDLPKGLYILRVNSDNYFNSFVLIKN